MDEEFGIPGMGTYAVPGWGGSSAEAQRLPTSPSQVPGTSGAPAGYTPSATPGGVATGGGTGTAGSPWGNLAGMLGMGGGAAQGGAGSPAMSAAQRNTLERLGMRMLGPPASPLRPGAPQQQLSTAGQNPLLAQIQRLYGVDAETAMRMLAMMQPGGGSAMNPSQQSQLYYATTFAPPSQIATPPTNMLPSSAMPTAANPYGTQRTAMAQPMMTLPPLGQGAFMPPSGIAPTTTQMYGSIA